MERGGKLFHWVVNARRMAGSGTCDRFGRRYFRGRPTMSILFRRFLLLGMLVSTTAVVAAQDDVAAGAVH
jgi:hypothetical protein